MRTTGIPSPAGAFSAWMMRRNSKLGPFSNALCATALDAEEKAARQIWELKALLRNKANSAEFWRILVEGMVEITGAQSSFVARQIQDDVDNSPLEDHPCVDPKCAGTQKMLAIASCLDDGRGKRKIYHLQEYVTEHSLVQDKVILIPHSLTEKHPIMKNILSLDFIPYEAMLCVPLSHDTETITQMGLLWTREGLRSKPPMTWGCITIILHALEDLVQSHLVKQLAAEQATTTPGELPNTGFPHCCKMSFKPYARNVSHELRTPMQGVVGMLDLIQASIKDLAAATKPYTRKSIVKSLLENIEVAQDSSMRAIYAADNMVHAYDLDMEIPAIDIPETYGLPLGDGGVLMTRRNSLLEINTSSMERSTPTAVDISLPASLTGVQKRTLRTRPRSSSSPPQGRMPLESTFKRSSSIVPTSGMVSPCISSPTPPGTVALIFDATGQVLLNSRPVKLREFLHDVIHQCLKMGGRPENTRTVERELGEIVTVTSKGNDKETVTTTIELSVAYEVPDFIIIDELALKKLISCVFHNAVKFSDGGYIRLTVSTANPFSRNVIFSISDTGCGIKSAFLPSLFKPFAREDTSITRALDGLGLGLMVAKGLARKMGGDVWCEWTSTKGPLTGSEFRIRLPTSPANTPSSLPGTPLKTPGAFIHSNASASGLDVLEPLVGSLKLDARRIIPNNVPLGSIIRPLPPTGYSCPTDFKALKPSSPVMSEKVLPRTTVSPLQLAPPVLSKPTKPKITLPPPAIAMPKASKVANLTTNIGALHPDLRILVAEDNPINRNLLVRTLERLGIPSKNIRTAVDGLEAIKIMEEDVKPDEPEISLVLMDLWMPKCDGYEATKKILAMQRYRDGLTGKPTVTILAVTADITRGAGRKAMEVGMRGLMAKPYRIPELQRLLLDHTGSG
ncbi:hypothetical protein BGX38DRAFT_1141233 [Terfezia claveryi]|nr:hypothetical protein BGX38DRAFT_1141233 [Terfezia claveryi]